VAQNDNFYSRDAILAWVLAVMVYPSIHPSVYHMPVLCYNG